MDLHNKDSGPAGGDLVPRELADAYANAPSDSPLWAPNVLAQRKQEERGQKGPVPRPPLVWACCNCEAEAPTAALAGELCGCPVSIRWIKAFPDTPEGRQNLASHRETYRSDLLK